MNENDIWLIAGLGNPEEAKIRWHPPQRRFCRAGRAGRQVEHLCGKTKFQGLWGQGEVDGHKVVLLKPLTYMNLSGDSIAPMAGFFKIPADHVLVLCDDITQAPGKLRIRPSGSAGGHNGLKSIIARLGGGISPHPHRHRRKAPPGLRPCRMGAGQVPARGRQGHRRPLPRP